MIPRTLFKPEHEQFRSSVRRFVEREIVPYHEQWEEQGKVDRDLWLKAGAAGLLCPNLPEAYGGCGADYLFNVVITEELARAGATGPGFAVHSDMVATYIAAFGTEAQKAHWLPKMAAGEVIGALGLTEPSAGSDLKGIRTRAVRDGDDYVINGQKVYISNGQLCDLIVLACKTDPAAGAKGMSFILVEAGREGFRRGRNLKKIGLKAQDTSELFFDDVRVPSSNLLGTEGGAFAMAMSKLAEERLTIAVSAMAVVEAALGWTIDYTADRKAFGQAIADFQNTRFKLAELHAQALALRTFVDRCIELHLRKELDAVDAAAAKMVCTELQCKVVDECLQFFGGYGYMLEYPIARAYIDARVRRIAGGSSEIMREIIGRHLFSKGK
ncbi:acyl-CoA dehydrogenase [Paraburkholderia sacchari]|uniref:acyl-CoA dehydrogenase family protein n=1 Tax=Paraburkholderia sacchari TaxID=159450 RepID=UPI0039A6B3D4